MFQLWPGESECKSGPSNGGHNRDKSSHCPQGQKKEGQEVCPFPIVGHVGIILMGCCRMATRFQLMCQLQVIGTSCLKLERSILRLCQWENVL